MSVDDTQPGGLCIWIDLDNTPHVPFFRPIIRELNRCGHPVACTARRAFQVCELAGRLGLPVKPIGRHSGRHPAAKASGLVWRAAQLMAFAVRHKPALALSHGSRSQALAARLLSIPAVMLDDYEFSVYPPLMQPDWEIVPEAIPADALPCRPGRVRKYPGIKEDVYVPEFQPDPALAQELGLSDGDLVVTVRPPATEAHYHNPESERLFAELMAFLLRHDTVKVVLLPRNARQARSLHQRQPEWFGNSRLVMPKAAVDGLNLIWQSDLVISGGGTMNREAAALGVPVYSIFRGRIGAVDRELERQGRLVLIERVADIERKIRLERRPRPRSLPKAPRPALAVILGHLEEILARETAPATAAAAPRPVC